MYQCIQMKVADMIVIFLFLLIHISKCIGSNINIKPKFAILNSTSTTKFICWKETADEHRLEANLLPNIPAQYVQLSRHQLNYTTAIEITLQAFDYIGAFSLICSSIESQSSGSRSDIIIGKPPGLLTRTKRCIVYYDKYIECTLNASIMVQAMNNGLSYNFNFIELPLFSRPRAYREKPKLVNSDSMNNQTVTFRWWPTDSEYFPRKLNMNVSATIHHFGTSNYIMDMTPIFKISSNFTIETGSSTDLQIVFNHGKFASVTICHGNLTNDEKVENLNDNDTRTFNDFNESIKTVDDLRPNTQYRLCFYCRRDGPSETISDVQCQIYKTSKAMNTVVKKVIVIVVIILSSILCAVLIPFIVKLVKKIYDCIKEELVRRHRLNSYGQSVDIALLELQDLDNISLDETIPPWPSANS